ncbi:hypothetical protein CDAR_22741 [Caerostris darwini]|uniref:Uncharacterized protein n=1 Tax=Caerostris darwini TaxID=1538125 RepID=A0AAV4RZS8_9ARAC|nr:hypothetical protein CDAR_22741 [Caerostris darwini]
MVLITVRGGPFRDPPQSPPHLISFQNKDHQLPPFLSSVISAVQMARGTGKRRSLLSQNSRSGNPFRCGTDNRKTEATVYHFTRSQGHAAKKIPYSISER